jgi:hypothetical protein
MRFDPGEVAQGHAGVRILKGLIDALTMGVAMYRARPGRRSFKRFREQLLEKLPVAGSGGWPAFAAWKPGFPWMAIRMPGSFMVRASANDCSSQTEFARLRVMKSVRSGASWLLLLPGMFSVTNSTSPVLPACIFPIGGKLRLGALALKREAALAKREFVGKKQLAELCQAFQRLVSAVATTMAVGPFVVARNIYQRMGGVGEDSENVVEGLVAALIRSALDVAVVDDERKIFAIHFGHQFGQVLTLPVCIRRIAKKAERETACLRRRRDEQG